MAPLAPRPPPFTHFLCLPLVTTSSRPQLTQALAAFRAEVTSGVTGGGETSAVPPDAVRPVGTLHLTLGMMSLTKGEGEDGDGDGGTLARAVALLRSLKLREMVAGVRASPAHSGETVALGEEGKEEDERGDWKGKGKRKVEGEEGRQRGDDGVVAKPLSVTLRGLHSMQRDASKAAVLYARPVESRRGNRFLQSFCEKVVGVFKEAGLMADDGWNELLLHATIVNTIYVKKKNKDGGGGRRGGGGRGKRVTVDASGWLDRYEDFVWMEDIAVEKLAICRMGAKSKLIDGVEDAEYEVEAEVEI